MGDLQSLEEFGDDSEEGGEEEVQCDPDLCIEPSLVDEEDGERSFESWWNDELEQRFERSCQFIDDGSEYDL